MGILTRDSEDVGYREGRRRVLCHSSTFEEAQRSASDMTKVVCGLISGGIQAGLFNPWDRALYLSVKHNRRLLCKANFASPYEGFGQSIVQRIFSAGLYFPLEEVFMAPAKRELPSNPRVAEFLAGSFAGALNAIIMNPAAAIKYQMWGSTSQLTPKQAAQKMWRHGNIQPFVKGISATLARDCSFGGVFALLRYRLAAMLPPEIPGIPNPPGKRRFLSDLCAGAIATIVSSPFNYVRSMQYAASPRTKPPSGIEVLTHLSGQASRLSRRSGSCASVRFVLRRLRVGGGTLRVGVGMSVGAHIYATLVEKSQELL